MWVRQFLLVQTHLPDPFEQPPDRTPAEAFDDARSGAQIGDRLEELAHEPDFVVRPRDAEVGRLNTSGVRRIAQTEHQGGLADPPGREKEKVVSAEVFPDLAQLGLAVEEVVPGNR